MVSPLTFGVELEFNVAVIGEGKDPHYDDPRPARSYKCEGVKDEADSLRFLMADRLREVGLSATADHAEAMGKDGSSPIMWEVTIDFSVEPDMEQPLAQAYSNFLHWHRVELISPVFYFCEEALGSVTLACEIITKHFRTANYRTSGFHIHMANGIHGFTLGTMKKLMVFLWAFEKQIDELHFRRNVAFAPSIREYSQLAHKIRSDDPSAYNAGTITLPGLERISGSNSMQSLLRLFEEDGGRHAGKMQCAFHNLCKEVYDQEMRSYRNPDDWEQVTKKTIEFRQGAGTLDPEWICMWIQAIMGFMESFLSNDNDEALQNLLLEVTRREIYGEQRLNIYDVFQAFGMVECQKYFWKTRLERAATRITGVMGKAGHFNNEL